MSVGIRALSVLEQSRVVGAVESAYLLYLSG